MKQVKEKVQRTIEIIKERGWAQGGLVFPDGACCLMGGILLAHDYVSEEMETRNYTDMVHVAKAEETVHVVSEAVKNKIEAPTTKETTNVWRWNDLYCRSQAEVIGLLEDVLKSLDSEDTKQ